MAPGWGRARRVALAGVTEGRITQWEELDVNWDVLHDEGSEGSHHARVARFLKDHRVEVVITGHLGAGMERMLGSMGVRVVQQAQGDARAAVLAVYADRPTGPN
ncbi:MAG TPA: NifB/NifX family molybdenum-iron cluster-binding protein [Kineosporiaceae bacterium]|nr:NifB/NifX family molybdenum-iron cluster-binding protein [Kineosporiaceae bacterium]